MGRARASSRSEPERSEKLEKEDTSHKLDTEGPWSPGLLSGQELKKDFKLVFDLIFHQIASASLNPK